MICLKMDYVSPTEEENPRSRLNLPEYGVREARLFHKIRDFVHSLYNRLISYNMVSPFF